MHVDIYKYARHKPTKRIPLVSSKSEFCQLSIPYQYGQLTHSRTRSHSIPACSVCLDLMYVCILQHIHQALNRVTFAGRLTHYSLDFLTGFLSWTLFRLPFQQSTPRCRCSFRASNHTILAHAFDLVDRPSSISQTVCQRCYHRLWLNFTQLGSDLTLE